MVHKNTVLTRTNQFKTFYFLNKDKKMNRKTIFKIKFFFGLMSLFEKVDLNLLTLTPTNKKIVCRYYKAPKSYLKYLLHKP